jgi:peptide subunit release factor 1 (eRF1)
VIARLNADFKQENDSAILARAGQAAEDDERSAEAALVQQITDFAGERGRGVLGLEETIQALVEGKVDTLVLSEGLSAEGSSCQNCGIFAAERFDRCPACSSEDVEHVPDVVELVVENALATGANVNFVYGGGAEMLQAQGGIGALLRYASPV